VPHDPVGVIHDERNWASFLVVIPLPGAIQDERNMDAAIFASIIATVQAAKTVRAMVPVSPFSSVVPQSGGLDIGGAWRPRLVAYLLRRLCGSEPNFASIPYLRRFSTEAEEALGGMLWWPSRTPGDPYIRGLPLGNFSLISARQLILGISP